MAWVVEQHLSGGLDRFEAKEFREHASTMLKIMRAKHSEGELEELRQMEERAKHMTNQRVGREVEQRNAGRR